MAVLFNAEIQILRDFFLSVLSLRMNAILNYPTPTPPFIHTRIIKLVKPDAKMYNNEMSKETLIKIENGKQFSVSPDSGFSISLASSVSFLTTY